MSIMVRSRCDEVIVDEHGSATREFRIFVVPLRKTVTQLIEYIVGASAEDGPEKCKGWCATEVIEVCPLLMGFVEGLTHADAPWQLGNGHYSKVWPPITCRDSTSADSVDVGYHY